jgi:drug/metabolite transporter (DMT)-like permease
MNSKRPLAALILLTLLWGATWVLTKEALQYAAPFSFAAWRCAFGVLVMFATLIVLRRPLKLVAPMKTFWFGLFNCAGFLLFQNYALLEGGAGKSAVLAYTMPIWTLLLAWLVLGERIRGIQWLATFGALAGLVLIVAPWSMQVSPLSKALSVGAALSWSIATIMLKRWRTELAADLLSVLAWHLVFATAVITLVALVVPEPAIRWTPRFIAIMAFISIIGTAFCWYLWLYILDRLPTWQASLSVLGVPAVATLGSRWQFGERIAAHELAGMLLIGTSLALLSFLNWRQYRRSRSVVAAQEVLP